ncbi:hypothetical protein HS961_12605 [Comamonas piscis]|uniref:Uncharacterized protein n=1 Tax=Comamonas piscis TaxID=1562974 RepID=A0A7G5EHX4_9BURK|nr:hypothetical protein [Comamonas piscis]QMV73599.1 hypothetical protein HS961_12605 [Comamonas piscis]WSO32021.1 hypothetical protein VUJ63_12640 [Comamonas piscis]
MSVPLLGQVLAMLGQVATSLGTAITKIAGVQDTANTIRTDITSARDNINTTTNNARDNVKTHVSTTVANLALRSPVKSVQSGTIRITNTVTTGSATITPVNAAACVVQFSDGVTTGGSVDSVVSSYSISGSTLTINRSNGNAGTRDFRWSIVEYNTNLG